MTDASVDAEGGLRARKRAQTAAAIERAALELVQRHGYEHVTVEMICEASEVSRRTFFNYFGSKEGVFLGSAPMQAADWDREAFLSSTGTDVLADLVTMIAAAFAEDGPSPEAFKARTAVIAAHPELVRKQIDRMAEQESKLVDLVLERFARQGRSAAATPDLADEARMVVQLVGSVMRFTAREWFDGRPTSEVGAAFGRAVDLVRRVSSSGSEPTANLH